eukprot:6195318-Pleurochrysis_carterae.AAC.1
MKRAQASGKVPMIPPTVLTTYATPMASSVCGLDCADAACLRAWNAWLIAMVAARETVAAASGESSSPPGRSGAGISASTLRPSALRGAPMPSRTATKSATSLSTCSDRQSSSV